MNKALILEREAVKLTPLELDSLANQIADRVLLRMALQSQQSALLDARQAADLLGCSVPTIERLTRSGEIPSIKLGRLRRYRREDLLSPEEKRGSK